MLQSLVGRQMKLSPEMAEVTKPEEVMIPPSHRKKWPPLLSLLLQR